MFQFAVFDLDGTLCDTQRDLIPSFTKAVTSFGYPPFDVSRFGQMIGKGPRESIRKMLPPGFSDEQMLDQMLAVFIETYDAHYCDLTRPFPGIPEALKKLSDAGVKLAVLSNKIGFQSVKLCKALLSEIPFVGVYGAEEGFPMKPDPAYLLHVMHQFGFTPEQTVYVGDSDVDIFTAQNVGCASVGCEWGYRGREELIRVGADHLAARPEDLPSIIL